MAGVVPTPTECAAIAAAPSQLGAVLEWAGVPVQLWQAAQQLLGVAQLVRDVACMPEGPFMRALEGEVRFMRPPAPDEDEPVEMRRTLNPAEQGRLGMVRAACCELMGLSSGGGGRATRGTRSLVVA